MRLRGSFLSRFFDYFSRLLQYFQFFFSVYGYFIKFRFKCIDPLVKDYIFSLQREVFLLEAAYRRHKVDYMLLNFRISLLEFRVKFRRYRAKILFHLGFS